VSRDGYRAMGMALRRDACGLRHGPAALGAGDG
jgi:hypothetical protein